MKVNEIFFSIQGESGSIGLPTIFVRFTGCNLRCTYCDTKYSYFEGEPDTPEGVMDKVRSYGIKRVCLTGGEPLIQPREEMQQLLDLLGEDGYEVSIETDGSIDISRFRLHDKQRFILDMKVPSSAMSDKMNFENLKRIVPERDEIKFVVGNREDYEWSKDLIRQYNLDPGLGYQLIFSPIYGELTYQQLVEWLLEDRIDARFQVQLHKIVWDPNQRGV
ncbi:radical SAM protein [Effusibacillus lacus]|uniref:7-carboxy-7-deazaguanine synthase n=1 Tax=Effusibacillus lacus TaxID=1348429 RepID=A0A292YJ72_9BACL|nr:radical SAM protein [Effusibacillus lacus]TCS74733.1 7-carboxy-7-deazaguanine synthase [Effusibacillus lacus]GAX88545.1 radical SAM protein [Effusibacillus lacus]